jgi:hypothetical protein
MKKVTGLIVLCLIVICAGAILWHRHSKAIDNYSACAAKYPVQQSYPEVCSVPGGQSFTNPAQTVAKPPAV